MWVVWWNGHDGGVCILAWWKLCGFCGNACGLPMDFQWPANTLRMMVLEAQDGVVMGVVWPLPSSLASGPLRILNEHFRLLKSGRSG